MQNRELKVLIHASTWFAPVLIPLIVFFASKEKEIKRLSLQALIFHLLISVLISISYFLDTHNHLSHRWDSFTSRIWPHRIYRPNLGNHQCYSRSLF